MKKTIMIPVEPKQFVMGKFTYNGNNYFVEDEFKKAVEKVNKCDTKERVEFFIANAVIPMLEPKLMEAANKNPKIGTVLNYDYKNATIDVEIDTTLPGYKIFKEYQGAIAHGNAIADITVVGEANKDASGSTKVAVKSISDFRLFIRKEVLVKDMSQFMVDNKQTQEVKIPMFIKRDKNNIYKSPNGWYYTKENLIKGYEKSLQLQEMIANKACPIINGMPNEDGTIPLNLCFGFVSDYNIEDGYVKVNVIKDNPHGATLLNNLDRIGKDLFAGMLMIAEPIKSSIVVPGKDFVDTKEMNIENIFGFQLITTAKNTNKEDTK